MTQFPKRKTAPDETNGDGENSILPAGVYSARLMSSANKVTRGGRKYIRLGFCVFEGTEEGSWVNENLWFDKETGTHFIKSSQDRLDKIAIVLGIDPLTVNHFDDIKGKPLFMEIDRELDEYWTDKNKKETFINTIKSFKPFEKTEQAADPQEPNSSYDDTF